MESSALGQLMREAGPTAYAFVNLSHVLGVASLFGSILVLDLRLLGFWRRVPLAALQVRRSRRTRRTLARRPGGSPGTSHDYIVSVFFGAFPSIASAWSTCSCSAVPPRGRRAGSGSCRRGKTGSCD